MPERPVPRIPLRLKALMLVGFLGSAAAVGQITVLGKQIFDMTGRELDLGLLGLAEFVPTALLAPLSGAIADRFDRRAVYACGLVGEALASFGLFWYVSTAPTSVLPIFGLATAFGVARGFSAPASRALPVDLAPGGLLERLVAVNSASWMAGSIAGPVVFGFAFVADVALPYAMAGGALAFGAVLLVVVPSSQVDRAVRAAGVRQALTDSFEGLRYIRGNRVLLGAISLDLFAVLFGGAVALLPAIADERLGVGAVGLGWLRASIGISAAATTVLLAARPLRRRVGRTLMGMVATFGVAIIVLGLTSSYPIAIAALMVAGATDAVSVFIRATLVPLATPELMRGRVLAVENVFIGGSSELGAFESGVAGHLLGVVGAVVTGGIGTLIVVALWWWWFPQLRGIDRFSDARPDATTDDPTFRRV